MKTIQPQNSQPQTGQPHRLWIGGALCCLLTLTGCQSANLDETGFDPDQDLSSEQEGQSYRPDQLARLKLTTEEILKLETEGKYRKLYDQYASPSLKKRLKRRYFLDMSQCVHLFLGDIMTYDRIKLKSNVANYMQAPAQPVHTFYPVHRKGPQGMESYAAIKLTVTRTTGKMNEIMTLVPNGLEYQLEDIQWITPSEPFYTCMTHVIESVQASHGKKPKSPTTEKEGPEEKVTPGEKPEDKPNASPSKTATKPTPSPTPATPKKPVPKSLGTSSATQGSIPPSSGGAPEATSNGSGSSPTSTPQSTPAPSAPPATPVSSPPPSGENPAPATPPAADNH